MRTHQSINPDEVLATLLARAKRCNRVRGLKGLHRLCRVQHEGCQDFSLRTIGRLCEAAGLFKARILYNENAEDYRALIHAWASLTAPERQKQVPQPSNEESCLASIDNPAVRALLRRVVIERDKFRAELSVLKAATVFTVDCRPQKPTVGATLEGIPRPELTPIERSALVRAISPEFFAEEGWTLGARGEVFNERGRKVYDVGYVRGLRKLLEAKT